MLSYVYLILFGGTSSASGGGGFTPSLDFSDARNSQYIPPTLSISFDDHKERRPLNVFLDPPERLR